VVPVQIKIQSNWRIHLFLPQISPSHHQRRCLVLDAQKERGRGRRRRRKGGQKGNISNNVMASSKTTNNIERHKKQRIVPNNGKGRPPKMPNNFLFLLLLLLILPFSSAASPERKGLSMLQRPQQRIPAQYNNNNQRNNSPGLPFNVILILPERESNNDKFGLTVSKVRPVIDIAIEDVIKHGRMPPGWINITYHDSRYWEDTLLAERVSATGVIQVC
jgi:hypothetical protein